MLKNKIKIAVVLATLFTTLSINGVTAFANPSAQEIESKVQLYDNQITNSMVKVEELNNQIKENEKIIKETKISIEKTKSEYEKARDIYSERIRTIYTCGGAEVSSVMYLDVILSSKSFGDLIEKFNTVKMIMNYDKEIQENLQNNQDKLGDKEQQLEESVVRLREDKEAIEKEMKNIEKAKVELQSQLTTLTTAGTQVFSLSRGGVNFIAPPLSEEASEMAKVVISKAQTYLGVPYVWGGTTPSGFDCSGLVQYVYGNSGIGLPRVASDQQRAGIQVPVSQMEPGDLVFFGYPAYHVGIYIGEGKYLHAPRTGEVVKIGTLNLARVSSVSRVIN